MFHLLVSLCWTFKLGLSAPWHVLLPSFLFMPKRFLFNYLFCCKNMKNNLLCNENRPKKFRNHWCVYNLLCKFGTRNNRYVSCGVVVVGATPLTCTWVVCYLELIYNKRDRMRTIHFMQESLYTRWHNFVCLMRHRVSCLVVNTRIGDKQMAYFFAICLSPIALNVMQFHAF